MGLERNIMERAEVLIEALPYIRRFNRKIIAVKYGGNAIVDEELRKHVIQDAVLLRLVSFRPIIVHGGGREISKWIGKAGTEPNFVNGLQVADEPIVEIAEMVLNKVNKSLVQTVNELGTPAVGVDGKGGIMLKCNEKYSRGEDIGFIGDIKEVNSKIIYDLLERDFPPIIYPVGYDDNYLSYNVNADDVACTIATTIQAERLVFLTGMKGTHYDLEDKDSLISEMMVEEAQEFVSGGSLGGGILPKLQNCIDAIKEGISRVHTLDGRIPHCLLLEIFINEGIGTAIINAKEEKFYHRK